MLWDIRIYDRWPVYGLSMVDLWSIYGRSRVKPGSIQGWYNDYSWMIEGWIESIWGRFSEKLKNVPNLIFSPLILGRCLILAQFDYFCWIVEGQGCKVATVVLASRVARPTDQPGGCRKVVAKTQLAQFPGKNRFLLGKSLARLDSCLARMDSC